MKTKIETIHDLPQHLLTKWRVFEFEEDGHWVTRFMGIGSHLRTPVMTPPIERFDPDNACGQDLHGDVWFLFPGEHAGQSTTGYETSSDVTSLFVETVALSNEGDRL